MSEQTPLSLGTEDIKKLLMRYAVPAIVAMTAASLYNMMDSIFIGHGVGALGIAGLAVTFPFINLAAAFGSLVGVGASTLVSVKMGQKDLKSAEAVLGNVLLLNTVIGFLFMTVCLIFLDPILYFFGASADTLPYDRKGGVGCNDSRQCGSHSGSCNDDFEAASGSFFRKFLHFSRSAVSRQGVHFKRDLHFIEQFGGLFHDGKVGSTAHNDTYNWFHSLFLF